MIIWSVCKNELLSVLIIVIMLQTEVNFEITLMYNKM